MWKRIAVMAVGMVLAATGLARAAEPLVDSAWVEANIGKPGVVFVDLRGKTDYLKGHVPGAVHTNYGKDGWRVAKDGVIGLMGDPDKLGVLIGGLGIDNATHVVLMPPGANSSDMGTGTRIYWTFKVLGHDNVSILNGGMAAYAAMDPKTKQPLHPLDKGMVKPDAKTFSVNLRPDMIPSRADVKMAMDKGVTLVDNRTADQYLGVNRHPKSKASGTIPGAKNLPQSWTTVNGQGTFRSKGELEALYAAAGVPTSGEQISFCNTGHWASIGWFTASEILGNKDAKMYDGSMVDWTADANDPVEQKIKTQ